MFHQEFSTPEELRDAIKCFWYTRRDFGNTHTGFEVVPDGYAEIIFHFGGRCSISQNGKLQPLPSPFMMGLLNHPMQFFAKDCLEILAIRCFPWTVFDLLRQPPAKDGLRMLAHPIAHLHSALEKLMEQGKMTEAVDLLKQFFLIQSMAVEPDSVLTKAGTAISQAKGSLPVSKVAAAAHATTRSLERKFKKSSGYSVKDVSGLMRFELVRNRLWTEPETNLAGLARELGFTDQSHMSREFKRYSGTTPAAFARKAKKGKQLVSPDFIAFIPGNA